MRIRKNTTDFSKEFLHEVFNFCKPVGVKSTKIDLYVGLTARLRHGHMELKSFGWDSNRIVLFIQDTKKQTFGFPVKTYRTSKQIKRGYLGFILLSRVEVLVDIMSHELRHVYQENKKHKIKVFGFKRTKFSERDADSYALRTVRKWRREHYRDAIDLGRCLS